MLSLLVFMPYVLGWYSCDVYTVVFIAGNAEDRQSIESLDTVIETPICGTCRNLF